MKAWDFLLFIVIALLVLVMHVKLAKFRIRQWAEANGYRLRSCKMCLADIGPFSYFGTSSGQSVFRIEAVSYDGKIRAGFARAGGFFFGLLRKRVEVKWDKNQAFEQLLYFFELHQQDNFINGQQRTIDMGMCVFPYFVTNVYLMLLVGVALAAVPYFIRWQLFR